MESQIKALIKNFEQKKYDNPISSKKFGTTYTPKKIVDYMCKKTLTFYLEKYLLLRYDIDKSQLDLAKLDKIFSSKPLIKQKISECLKSIKLLDPSCGSGRFLIALAEQLFIIFRNIYPSKDEFLLKKRIIERNIHGIDIEKKACLISKLRLILWLYSDKIPEKFKREKKIDLQDINKLKLLSQTDFNIYHTETLLKYRSSKKFDIIIGNPPYVENKKIRDKKYKKELYRSYESAYKLFDLSILFIESALKLLKEDLGFLCFIITNKFLSADYGIKIRDLLINKTQIVEVINVSSLPIFKNRSTYPVIITINKQIPGKTNHIEIKKYNHENDLVSKQHHSKIKVKQDNLRLLPKHVIPIKGNVGLIIELFSKHESMKKMFEDLTIGYRPYGFTNYAKFFDKTHDEKDPIVNLPLIIGTGNVGMYHIKFNKRIKIAKRDLKVSYFIFPPDQSKKDMIISPKIMVREIAKNLTCVYDYSGIFTNVTGLYFLIIPSLSSTQLFALMTVLNSSFIDHIFKSLYGTLHMQGHYLRFNGSFIKTLPIPSEGIPKSIGHLGMVLQFLAQLNYDLKQNKEYYNDFNGQNIHKNLNLLNDLSESLINVLYLSVIKKEIRNNFQELIHLLYSTKLLLFKEYKYTYPYFSASKFQAFNYDQVSLIISQINSLINELNNNKKLMKEIRELKYLI